MTKEYARVYLLDAPFCIDRIYDYYVPTELRDSISPGCFVSVPFGGGNRPKLAIVFELADTTEASSVKALRAVVSSDISLDEKMLGLALFIKQQTLCTVGDAIHAMVPAAALSKLVEYYRPSPVPSESKKNSLSPSRLLVYEYVCSREHVSFDALKNKFGAGISDILDDLLSSKLIEKELVVKDSDEARAETVYSLSEEFLSVADRLSCGEKINGIKLSSERHRSIVSLLSNGNAYSREEICKLSGLEGKGISPQLKALCEKGLLVKSSRKKTSSSLPEDMSMPSEIKLSLQQTEAYNTLSSLADSGSPKAALLFGITGSGKTQVILKTIDHILST